ncbi:MAG: phasin family protein [Pseudomonadota bacterium]
MTHKKNGFEDHRSVPFAEFSDAALESANHAYNGWMKAVIRTNSEIARFTADRLRKDMTYPMSLAQCQTPQDMVTAHFSFLQSMAADYTSESHKMGEIIKDCFNSEDRPTSLN